MIEVMRIKCSFHDVLPIKSDLIGTFYLNDNIYPGMLVEKGQILGITKIFEHEYEIESPEDGLLIFISKDKTIADYGKVIAIILPYSSGKVPQPA